jgi:hypothetical protein
MVAQKHKRPFKTKSNGAAPAHTRSEVMRNRWRDNFVAEIKKLKKLGVPWGACWLYLHSGKATLAVMYLRRVRIAGRRFASALTPAHV